MRVSDGFVPYAEMHTPYGPASYYIRALIFGVLGRSIAAMGVEFIVWGALFAASSYWALRGCTTRRLALLVTLLAGTVGGTAFGQHAAAYVAIVVAVGCMVRYSRRSHVGWLVATGAAVGFVGAARWDFGVYCVLVFGVVLAGLPFVRRVAAQSVGEAEPQPVGLRVHARRFAALVVPAAVVALPFYAPVLFTDPLAFVRSFEIVQGVRPYRTLPWPTLPNPMDVAYGKLTIGTYLDAVVGVYPAYAFLLIGPANAVALVVALLMRPSGGPGVPLLVYTQVTTLLAASLLYYGSSRADIGHLLPSAVFALLSLPLVYWSVGRLRDAAFFGACILRWGLIVAALVVVLPAFLSSAQWFARGWAAPPPEPFSTPALAGMAGDPAQAREYDALVRYVTRHTEPGKFIFSGNVRHDRLDINDVLIYFASGRHSGVRDYHMDPGSTTTRHVQQQIIRDMERNDVDLVVLRDEGLPPEPDDGSGVAVLDNYIRDNYVVRERFGSYLVLTARKLGESSCASVPERDAYGSVDHAANLLTGGVAVARDGELRIGGWAATPTASPPLDRVEVRVEGRPVGPVTQCIPRKDVAEHFGRKARNSGWEVLVDLGDVGVSGRIDIEAEAVDRDGSRNPLPVPTNMELRVQP